MKKWGLADSAACECVEPEQSQIGIVVSLFADITINLHTNFGN